MQHTLSFMYKNKKYVSRVFDFETMCLINDLHNSDTPRGPLNICRDAVDYMFEGTQATQDIIDGLDVNQRTRLCMDLWGFYVEAITAKKTQDSTEEVVEA